MTTKIIQADGIIVHCEHTKIIPVAKLNPYPKNNKIHPPDQITLLSKAIKAQGWRAPITVSNQSGYIVRGHARLEAAKKLGAKSVPVDYQDYASEQAERADRIADNKIADLGEWDLPNLKDELLDLDSGDMDLDITGFDKDALEELMNQTHQDGPEDAEPQVDKAEELNKVWKVKVGDLWQIGEHRLLCGDCTDKAVVERVTGGEKAELVFTDPPYGISVVGKNGSIGKGVLAKEGKCHPVIGDNKDFDPAPLLKLSNQFIIWGANFFPMSLPFPGQWIVWDKKRADGTTFSDCELAWTTGGGIAIKKYECTWAGMIREGESGQRYHPTQKPVKLCTDILMDWDQQIILDPFLGSGTTMVACQNLNRKCRGIEISPAYCAVILQRMTDAFPGIKIGKVK